MRCPECAAETAGQTPLCAACGAPTALRTSVSVPADPADGMPGKAAGKALAPAAAAGPATGRAPGTRLRVAGALVGMAAATALFVAWTLPFATWQGAPVSAFTRQMPAVAMHVGMVMSSFCMGGAVLAFGAALAMAAGSRLVPAGVLLASGILTITLFFGVMVAFAAPSGAAGPNSVGPAVGMTCGLMLGLAGVLGLASYTAGRAAPDRAAGSGATAQLQPDEG